MRIASIAAIAAASLSCLAVASCTTVDGKVDQINGKIQTGLADACPRVAQADLAFSFAKLIFSIPQSVIDAEAAAYQTAQEFCADPSSVSLQTAPQKVLNALDDINAARAKAGGSN